MSMAFFAQSTVNSGTAIPYQRVIEPSQLGMYLNLEQAELLRIRRYHEHWRFYIGQHWAFTREGGEPLVTLNYARRAIDKSVSWLVGAGMTIKVPDALKNYTLPVLDEVWKYNYRDQVLYNSSILGGVTGDVFILVTYAEPTLQARRINPHTRGQIRIQLLNSEQVYPQWDPLNTDVLTSVRIETIYYDDRAQTMKDAYDNQARQLHTRRFSQIITRDQIIEQYQGQDPIVRDNPLGEIPLIHIKNHPLPGEYYGLADMDNLLDIQREVNEKATDVSDIINYHAAPVTVITGAKVKQLERSPRNIWSGLPADAKAYNLTMGDNLPASSHHLEFLKTAFLELAEIPKGSLGDTQPISNTSGVALHTQYQPLVEKTARKRAFYEPGFAEVNYYILRIMEVTDPSFYLPTDLCKNCGGRIVEFEQPNGRIKRKCYRIDEQTFDFLKPEEVVVRHARQHSFGTSVEEAPLKQVLAEHGQHAPSAYDPEPTKSAEDKAKELHAQEQRENPQPEPAAGGEAEDSVPSTPTPAAPKPEPPQLPASAIELPPEPEKVTVQRILVDPASGEERAVGEEVMELIPTGCKRCDYLNPYSSEVVLNDTLPKDKQLQATLYETYQRNRWVSAKWVRRHIEEIAPEADQIEKELAEEDAKQTQAPAETTGGGVKGAMNKAKAAAKASGQGEGAAGDEDTRTEGPPFGSNLPGG